MRPPTRFPHVLSRLAVAAGILQKRPRSLPFVRPRNCNREGVNRHGTEGGRQPADCFSYEIRLFPTPCPRARGNREPPFSGPLFEMALALPIESMTGRFNLVSWQTTFDPCRSPTLLLCLSPKRVPRAVIFIVIRKTLLLYALR